MLRTPRQCGASSLPGLTPPVDAEKLQPGESGAVLLITAAAALLFIILAAYVVDFGYARIVGSRLQSVADASALAGTCELVYTNPGWIAAKRASLLAIKINEIRGFEGDIATLGNPGTEAGTLRDTMEIGSSYAANEFAVGNLHVRIERGLYYSTDGGCTYQFVEFETLADDSSGSGFTVDIPPPKCSSASPCSLFAAANAVKATLTVEIPTYFSAAVPGFTSLTITRDAVAARDYLVSPPPTSCP